MIERTEELVDGVGAEGVTDLGPIERDSNDAGIDRAVVRDVGEVEAGNVVPGIGVEDLRHLSAAVVCHGCSLPEENAGRHIERWWWLS